ncbi:hypothetical protein TrLO_g7860 [Triparma laevis f. longispina]|uniref:Uncharacterized protein n=1 Tax=Triparma laevis f. longispina TaxID=1714387 RepID=A0A9W7DZ56_9STRA|nr:hypothetical protein TrLO_g7860 [Triparma laevis f. longispina]
MIVWRLLTNGVVAYLALEELGESRYLGFSTGLVRYVISLALAAVGPVIFFRYCDEDFDLSIFWRPYSGKQHVKEWFTSDRVNNVKLTNKDEERWNIIKRKHPVYLPFEEITLWLCKHLVETYEDRNVERPVWMTGKNEDPFIKRIVAIYEWKNLGARFDNELNEALTKLFGRSGADLEVGVNKQLTFIKSKRSHISRSKIYPEVDKET